MQMACPNCGKLVKLVWHDYRNRYVIPVHATEYPLAEVLTRKLAFCKEADTPFTSKMSNRKR